MKPLHCARDDVSVWNTFIEMLVPPPAVVGSASENIFTFAAPDQIVPPMGAAPRRSIAMAGRVLEMTPLAVFWRTLPWDHVPGALLLSEAGGFVARWDGTPYRAGDPTKGLLAAGSEDAWREVQRALL